MEQLTFKIERDSDGSKLYEIYIGKELGLDDEIDFIKRLQDVQIFDQEHFIKAVIRDTAIAFTVLYTLIEDIYKTIDCEIDWLFDANNNPILRPKTKQEREILKIQMPSMWNEKETEEIKELHKIKS